MFCMNCGQELPEGAKFCFKCGKALVTEYSTSGSIKYETVNLDGKHTFVPAMCPNCGAHMEVDPSTKTAHCRSCGTDCLVQDAIKSLSVIGTVHVNNANINATDTNIDALLERAEILLEDGDFGGVKQKCERVLDIDPENCKAYLYMLLSSLGCRKLSDLANQPQPFDIFNYYKNLVKYCDSSLKSELEGYLNTINSRNEAEIKKAETERELKRKNPKVGDIIELGVSNGNHIKWKVLDVKNQAAFLMCEDDLYNVSGVSIHISSGAWENWEVRKWLNYDFFDNAYSKLEKKLIIPWKLYNPPNAASIKKGIQTIPGGAPTTDKVFLLSPDEILHYFKSFERRARKYYWSTVLRTSNGPSDSYLLCAEQWDNVLHMKRQSAGYGLLPAMWIKLDPEKDDSFYSEFNEEIFNEYKNLSEKRIAAQKNSARRQEREARIKNSSEYIGAIGCLIFRIVLILWSIFSYGVVMGAIKVTIPIPLITFVFLAVILITSFFCAFAYEVSDPDIFGSSLRPIFVAPFEFALYILILYLKAGKGKYPYLVFLFIAVAFVIAGWIIAKIIGKRINKT